MKDDIGNDGRPNTCGRCGEVMQLEDDGYGPYCNCPRFVAILYGGPGDGTRERLLYPSDGELPIHGWWSDAEYVLVDVLDEQPGGPEMGVYFEAGQVPDGN